MMQILHYSRKSAVLDLSQLELLLAMALMHAGRNSLSCNTGAAETLDQLFVAANILVEQARRKALKTIIPELDVTLVSSPFQKNNLLRIPTTSSRWRVTD
jgi:hypothetical protein